MGAAPLIMIIDDDAAIREAVAEILEDHGYRWIAAQNGEEAWRQLQQGDVPDLILLDVMMPIMDGRAFRVAQRGDPRLAHVPVIVMTAQTKGGDEDLVDVARLNKPITLEALLAAVRAGCGPSTHTT